MSRRDPWGWYPVKPKRPPPQHGIKMTKAGATWWGLRWIEALEAMSSGYTSRLARGKTYARAGRVHDLAVRAGEVAARVTGSQRDPYQVVMTMKCLSDAAWTSAIAALAGEARFTADLLAGQMPREIDAVFKTAGTSLFPVNAADLTTACSCPDWANPCKHVAAAHYVLGEAFDRDPFLLFELRGRGRDEVLDALRAARTGDDREATAGRTRDRGSVTATPVEAPGIRLGRLTVADYETLPVPLPELNLSFETPAAPFAILRQLGVPPGWSHADSPADLFAPILAVAAERARRLALADPDSVDAAALTLDKKTSATTKRGPKARAGK